MSPARWQLGMAWAVGLTVSGCAVQRGAGDAPRAVGTSPDPVAAGKLVACDALARRVAHAERLSSIAEGLLLSSLERHEGTVVRWPSPRPAIRVWLQPRDTEERGGQHADDPWRDAVRHAVRDWDRARAGVRLRLTADSSEADVRMRWVARPGGTESETDGRSGVIRSARSGAIEAAEVAIGTIDARGEPRSRGDLHAIAVHEVGHVLGLSHARAALHAANASSIMAARVTADEVTPDDHAVLRAWYALPVGMRCRPSTPD